MSDTSSEADQQSSLGSSSPTPSPPTTGENDKPNIGAKIHQFENGEREKVRVVENEILPLLSNKLVYHTLDTILTQIEY